MVRPKPEAMLPEAPFAAATSPASSAAPPLTDPAAPSPTSNSAYSYVTSPDSMGMSALATADPYQNSLSSLSRAPLAGSSPARSFHSTSLECYRYFSRASAEHLLASSSSLLFEASTVSASGLRRKSALTDPA